MLENCAYACWVLDPRTTGKQRGARVLAAALTTVTHLRAAVAEVAGVNGDEYKTLSEGFDQLVAIANELFSPFTPPKSRDNFTVGGERYPSFTQAVNVWADGPGGGRVSGRGLYGVLCSDTHPKALAARLSWNTDPQADVIVQSVTFSYLDRSVTAALSPSYHALVCPASYHGWLGNGALSEFETAYEALAPGALM